MVPVGHGKTIDLVNVSEVMYHSPATLSRHCSFREAVIKFADGQLPCAVITDNDRPIGILTERDIVRTTAESIRHESYLDLPIAEIMTAQPVCVHHTATINDAMVLSRSRNLRHLPVIDDNTRLVGLVTQSCLVNAFASVIEHQNHLEMSIEQLKSLSLLDPLLEIGNRRAMEVELGYTQNQALSQETSYGIALLDIDYFKRFNDHYGHQAGDKTLQVIAKTIKESIRETDRVFRYGGEELLIIMPDTDQASAKGCAERVRLALEKKRLEHCDAPLGIVTLSCGIAVDKKAKWSHLLRQADQALYRAKNRGRNNVEVAQMH